MFKINYGDKVINVPGSAMDAIKRADAKTLRALLIFASHPGEEAFELCSEYGLTRAAMENAQSFWQGAGVLDLVDDADPSEGRLIHAEALSGRQEGSGSAFPPQRPARDPRG